MSFSLFYLDIDSDRVASSPANERRRLAKEFNDLGLAINAACDLLKKGATVLQITGTQGFVMEREDIETECRRRDPGP